MSSSNRWLKAALAAAVLLGAPAIAQAQSDARGTDARGPYVGGGIGMGSDSNTVWNLIAGYRLHRNIALELGYSDFRDMNINGHPLNNSNAIELSALGILPLNDTFSVYGRLGAYRGQAKGDGFDEKHGDLLVGAGAEYAATRDLGVRVQWSRFSGFGGGGLGSKDQDVFSLNGVYYFR
jgi:hypothetical protein